MPDTESEEEDDVRGDVGMRRPVLLEQLQTFNATCTEVMEAQFEVCQADKNDATYTLFAYCIPSNVDHITG